jgi:hypothetical protein
MAAFDRGERSDRHRRVAGVVFFVGLAFGLLAKGPTPPCSPRADRRVDAADGNGERSPTPALDRGLADGAARRPVVLGGLAASGLITFSASTVRFVEPG